MSTCHDCDYFRRKSGETSGYFYREEGYCTLPSAMPYVIIVEYGVPKWCPKRIEEDVRRANNEMLRM